MTLRAKCVHALLAASLYAYAWWGPWGWLAGWIWPVPLLALSQRTPRLETSGWVLLSGYLGAMAWWPMERGVMPLPLFGLAHLLDLIPLLVAILVFQFRSNHPWRATLAFAATWTLLAAIAAAFNPHGTWGQVFYTQTTHSVMWALAWGGPYSLLLLMALTAALIASLKAFTPRGRIVAGCFLISIPLVFATASLSAQPRNPEPTWVLALAADDLCVPSFKASTRTSAMPAVTRYVELCRQLAEQKPEAILLPEKMVGIKTAYAPEVDTMLAQAAPHTLVVAGLNQMNAHTLRNVAKGYTRGSEVFEVIKRHPIPGYEDGYEKGKGPNVFQVGGIPLGVAICKDFDFPDTARIFGNAGAKVVLAPAWDFAGSERIHAHMARFRAVEGGFTLARTAQDGHLDVWDSRGRSLGHAETRGGTATLVVAAPLGAGHTLYSRWGNWIHWVCALMLLWAMRPSPWTSRNEYDPSNSIACPPNAQGADHPETSA